MTDFKPENSQQPQGSNIGDELKELGRQLAQTVKAIATSDEVRNLGTELRDGFREVTRNVEDVVTQVRERDEVQRLKSQAGQVAQSFKTGDAQRELREEIGSALQTLNARLRDLLDKIQPADSSPSPPASQPNENGQGYTGQTVRLERDDNDPSI